MSKFRTIISTLFLLIIAVWSTQAQSQCNIDVETIIASVTTNCENMDANEVCYGNRNVTAQAQDNVEAFEFNNPGDIVSLSSIQSLIVDSIENAQDNTWGVAQMRLLVGSGEGLRDVNMLLFGEFDARNAVEPSDRIELLVQVREKTIHNLPDLESDVLATAVGNETLIGLERLEDTSWLRVETSEGIVGWTERSGVEAVNEAQSVGLLKIQDATSPYYGAMQAFYFENGESNIGCDNVESDGIIIQTPEGQARVSLLINEVSVELVGVRNRDGENESGRAFIQADPLSPRGMSVNILSGEASVQTSIDSEPVTVVAGERTSIPISVNIDGATTLISPSGAPEMPVAFELDSVSISPLLPAINNANSGNGSGNANLTINSNSSGSPINNSGSGNVNLSLDGSGNNSSSGSGSNNSNNNGTSTGVANTSGSSSLPSTGSSSGGVNNDTNTSSSSSSSAITGSNNSQISSPDSPQNFGFGEQGNVIAAILAGIGAVLVMGFIIWSARRPPE